MRWLALIALLACTPQEPDTDTSDTSTEGGESTTEDSGEDNWGIVLDVGPPYYGTETDTG